jgi:hypothetical protein
MDSKQLIDKVKKQNDNLRLKLKLIEEKYDKIRLFLSNMNLDKITVVDKKSHIYCCHYSADVIADTEKSLVSFVNELCDTPFDIDNLKSFIEEE